MEKMIDAIMAKFYGDPAFYDDVARHELYASDYDQNAYRHFVYSTKHHARLSLYFGPYPEGYIYRTPAGNELETTTPNAISIVLAQVPSVNEAPCAAYQIRVGDFCRPRVLVEKCRSAGWTLFAADGACGVPVTAPGQPASDRCYVSGIASPQCADVFGADLDFPAPAVDAGGATLSFVFNCDPRGINLLLPATINTVRATACTCPGEDYFVYNGVCARAEDVDLINETLRDPPDLDVVRTLLDNGANPNTFLPDGTALLAAAVTLNRAGVASVLITAGANPTARVTRGADSHLLPDFFAALPDGIQGANLLIHWDPAVQIAALTSDVSFNWRGAAGDSFIRQALDAHARPGLSAARQAEVEVMIAYAQSRGARGDCDVPPFANQRACNAPRVCNSAADSTAYSCSACANAPLRSADGAACVSQCESTEILGAPTSWGEAQCACPAAGQGVAEGVCRICPQGSRVVQGACTCFNAGEGLIDGVCAACPQGASLTGGSCACPPGQEAAAGLCVSLALAPAAKKCAAAGWEFSPDSGGICKARVTRAEGNSYDRCYFSGSFIPQCAAVFGADLDFPAPIVRGGATLSFVYNCDPHGTSGRIPATINTVGATSCCQAGQSVSRATGGACLDPGLAAEAQKCADAGWEYSPANGGTCEVPVRLSGANLFARCYFSGSFIPQCKDVFADKLAFPAKPLPPATLAAFVYNCDPNGESGLIPATVNTFGATECACPLGGDANCACPAGESVVDGVCRLPGDAALIAETLSPLPRLSTIRALLTGGANPAVTLAGGTPLVVAALTLNRPKVLSVLITAGADPYVVYRFRAPANSGASPQPVNIPLYVTGLNSPGGLNLLRHWGGAAAILAGSSALDWSQARGNSDGAFRNLADRYSAANSGRQAEMRAMGGYLLDLGAACSDYVANSVFNLGIDYNTPLCKSRPACSSASDGFIHDCLACSGFPLLQGGVCVSVDAGQKCRDAGWNSPGNGICGIPVTLSGGKTDDQCRFSGSDDSPQCASIFGTLPNFPTPALDANGATLRFVYNCDPDGDKRQIPATINTVGATACACAADGEEVVDGICVPACANDEIRMGGICAPNAVADRCRNAGWPLLQAEGACGILLTLSGGDPADRCNLVGSAAPAAPQCDRVFGATPRDFPSPTLAADGATLRFVYNCDPDGKTGFIPATANTIAATACRCPDGQALLENGSCVPDEIMADARNCLAAGRAVDPAQGGSCAVAVTLSGGDLFDKCYFSGANAPQCANVFGKNPVFPVADAAFIYNCDPSGRTGLLPSTINRIEATECACSGGQEPVAGFCVFACPSDQSRVNGVCVPDSLAPAAQKCANANRQFSVSDGGSCEVPVRPGGGGVFSRCYFSGSFTPQCADVFGPDLAFPAELSAPAVYDCDPSRQTGFLPSTINTVAATECACPAGERPVGGICVSAAVVDQCQSNGWTLSVANGSCGIPLTTPGGADYDRCYFAGDSEPQCAGVFGATVNYFPTPALAADGATLRFVFNCDPDGGKSQIPATINTIGATECSCVDGGEEIVGEPGEAGGICVPGEIAVAAQKCLDVNRRFSEVNGGSCAIAVTLSGEEAADRCYLSGVNLPQCETVFGADLPFPADDPGAPVIYNCDPDDQNGFLPATINTVGAVACFCPAGEEPVGGVGGVGGSCVPGVIASVAQNCLDAGREFSKADGGSCAVAVTLFDGADYDKCYFSGESVPQCAEVFGTDPVFPATDITVIYNCDPDSQTGFLPATINTVEATECACPAGETSVGGACVANAIMVEAQKCLDAGWTFSEDDGGSCAVAVTLSGGTDSDRCYLSGSTNSPQCETVFGADLAFPADDPGAPVIYNCDPDGSNGFLPATVNTVGATACVCPDGRQIVGGVGGVGGSCVPDAVADAAKKCLNANRELSAADGGSCAAAVRHAGGALYDKCYFSGVLSPQCEEVFGAELVFPAADPGVTVIYNCDPDPNSGKGLVPATINTVGATDCSCAVAGQSVVGGVCRCPDGEGLDNGICGVCAGDEEGVLPDGTCGACPDGHAIDNGVCVASAVVENCKNAGWESSLSGGGACGIPLTLSGGMTFDQCYFAGVAEPQCLDVFGSTVNYFPRPAVDAGGATLRFVYNCDPNPDASNGFLPATVNTIRATACACPAGKTSVDGVCVPGAVAAEARICREAGWKFSEAGGGNCAVPLAPANGPNADRCYFTGAAEPQCLDVFGATIHYFPRPTLAADGATLRFVYDCDPNESVGFLPATANTVGATACACPDGEKLVGGACIPVAIAVGAQNCLNANRDFSESDGGSCVVPAKPAGGIPFSRCYFSGSFVPQCEDIFGPALVFPDQLAAPVVYDCDPSRQTGFLPSTINTVAATECACPAGERPVGGICVSAAVVDQCQSNGWTLSAADGGCGIPLTLSGGADFDRCYFAGDNEPQCADVFGATANYFPSPTVAADGATLRFVYGCDPDGSKSQIPATANTIGATECSCVASGEKIVGEGGGRGGRCVPGDVAAAAQNCLDSGRVFSRINGGSCPVAVTLSGGLDSDRCYVSGDNTPQCENVFGAGLAFPADPGAPLVYNCDPDGNKGFLPATVNTVGAVACFCPVGEEPVGDFCVPAAMTAGAQNCLDAGRGFSRSDGGSCAVAVTLFDGADYDKCYFSGGTAPQCAEVFGADLVFPAADVTVIYNCDPNSQTGFLPTTINTVEATECACPAGEEPVGGVCVANAIAVGAQNCLDAGRGFSKSDGGSCAVAVTLFDGADYDKCYFSGGSAPQCAEVFGANLVFPATDVTVIYNCDPDSQTGFLPTTINTVEATECACPSGEAPVGDFCVPAAMTAGAQNCLDAGRGFSRSDGGSCAVAVTLFDGAGYDKCYFSDGGLRRSAPKFSGRTWCFPQRTSP